MTLHLINPKATATGERDRLAAFLTAIGAVKTAKAKAEADGHSLAAEYLALDALVEAEDRLVALALDPELASFLDCILNNLADIAAGRP